MKRGHIIRAVAAVLALFAAPAAAQVASLRNTVSCVHDSLSIEDREIALLLIAREIMDGTGFSQASPHVAAVERLVAEAHDRCLDRFNWSAMRSETASSYAITRLVGEALSQAIESYGLPRDPLEAFYTANRAQLARQPKLTEPDKARLQSYLTGHGWGEAEEGPRVMAALYIETRMLNETAAHLFAMAGGSGRRTRPRP